MTLALIVAGVWSMTQVPLDAVPDITNNQVQVITTAPSLSTEDIEQFVTYPVELAMANIPGVMEIRSTSRFGLSVVTIVFEDDMGTYLPRQLVAGQLSEVESEIPESFGTPVMGPVTTGLGEIYQYTIDPKPGYDTVYSDMEIRSIQDWIVKRQMSMLPGVVEVNGFGGHVKQYEIAVNPDRMNSMGISILDIYRAVEANNENTGGAYIERNHEASFIRGEGLARSISDIEQIPVTSGGKAPVLIRDVAEVQLGSAVRYGAFTKDGDGEAVGGIIMMLKGANSNEVIRGVKERMVQVEQSLPEGLEINAFLDRSDLIARTSATITRNLAEGALIVVLVLVLLLGNLRGGLIVGSVIPLSLLFAFILMKIFGVWANLMSLGAIDFGIIVDGAVIIVEGVVYSLGRQGGAGLPLSPASQGLAVQGPAALGAASGRSLPAFSQQQMDKLVFRSGSSMMNTAFFGQLIILIVFTPILALEGVEGKMFKPMAYTFGFAVLGAILLCLTYVPVMSALLLKPGSRKGKLSLLVGRGSDKLMSFIRKGYAPALRWSLGHGKAIIAGALILLASSIFVFSRMGGEFIPQLDEGDIAFHAIMKPGTSLSETIDASTKIEKLILADFPEAEHVLSRIGVADVPTDPMPMDIADIFIILKPENEWVSAASKEELIRKIKETIAVVPGVNYEFTQPIEMRFNELISGVREDIAIKLYGEDLDMLAAKAEEMGKIIASVEGVGDLKVEATTGLPQITVVYDRARVAQYGLNIRQLNSVVSTAFAGGKAGVIFEGERRFDLVVRLDEASRGNIRDLKNLYISVPGGGQVPLSTVAKIEYQPGPMQISRDDTKRRTYVGINVRGRDTESLVEAIRKKLDRELELPPGYYIEYGGAFENLERAGKRLTLVVPLALFLIFILLYFALHSISQTLMISIAIPLAAIGGVLALSLRGMPFSISAGVGFVVLFGVAVLNGLVLVSRFNTLKAEGVPLSDRIQQGAGERIRPVLLTALAAIMGFLPMAVSTSAGAEVQRPLATVVIGGLITCTLLTLLVLPVLYQWTERRSLKHSTGLTTKCLSILLLSAGLLLSPAAALQAQDTTRLLTLKDALEEARANYPSIKTARLQVEQQQALKKTAWQLGRTQVFTGEEEVGHEQAGVRTIIGVGQQNIDIFGGFSRSKWRNELLRLSEINVDITRLQVLKNTASAYYHAAFARSRLKLARELDSIYRRFEEAALLRYETGESPRLEYLAAQGKYQEVTLAAQQAEDDYQLALGALSRWTGVSGVSGSSGVSGAFRVNYLEEMQGSFGGIPAGLTTASGADSASLNNPQDGSAGTPLRKADSALLGNNPLLGNSPFPGNSPLLEPFRQDIRIQEARIKLEKSALLPTFSGQYGWQSIGGRKGFHSWQAGINIPLWFVPKKGEIKAAKTGREIAENRLLLEKAELQSRYRQLLLQLRKVRRTVDHYRKQALPLAAEQLTAADKSYRYGEIDYTAFIQLADKATRSKGEYLEYLNGYYQTLNELHFIYGR